MSKEFHLLLQSIMGKSAGLSQYFVEQTGSFFLETYVQENSSKNNHFVFKGKDSFTNFTEIALSYLTDQVCLKIHRAARFVLL